MKKLLAAIMLALPLSAGAGTLENPDRYISLGLDITYGYLPHGFPGLVRYDPAGGQNTVGALDQSLAQRWVVADVRAPVNNWLTLTLHGGPWSQEGFSETSRGYTFGGGLRVYLTADLFNRD